MDDVCDLYVHERDYVAAWNKTFTGRIKHTTKDSKENSVVFW